MDNIMKYSLVDKLNVIFKVIIGSYRPLPSVEKSGVIAVGLSGNLTAQEQSYFVAGFQECIKYLNQR